MSNILTLDEELEQAQLGSSKLNKSNLRLGKKVPAGAKKKVVDIENDIDTQLQNSNKKEKDTFKPKTNNADRLSADVNNTLNMYLKKTPQYRILNQQLNLLKEELLNYKKSGDENKIESCKNIIKEVIAARKRIAQVFRTSNSGKNEVTPTELKDRLRDSEVYQSLISKQKELLIAVKESTPSWYGKMLRDYRKQLEIRSKATEDNYIDDIDNYIDNEMDDLAQDDDELPSDLETEYINFCGKIGEIIGETATTVDGMKISVIVKELANCIGDNSNIKDELQKVKLQVSQERQKLSGQINIADIMFEIFDYTEEEKVPKEILAASSIPLVKSIAYNIVSKIGALDDYDDAVSFGLLGLTVAINKWYTIQKMENSPITFNNFANVYVNNSIRRGLLEFAGNGALSGSTYATLLTRQKQKIDQFIKFNPELKNFNRDMIESLLSNFVESTSEPINIVKESELTDIVGGEEGGGSDIWANSIVDNGNSADSKMMYANLIDSIKKLMNLFETETDKSTGIKTITKRKLFDKYDLRLFMMYFGLEYKVQKSDEVKAGAMNAYYTQKEMAEELVEMYHANGLKAGKSDSFTSSAISTRISTMLNKIKIALDENPNLKMGFDYIRMNWEAHRADMELLSNQREELGMKIERDDLREMYADDEEALKTQLTDGKRLSDVFEVSDTNPLEEEIGAIFDGLYE